MKHKIETLAKISAVILFFIFVLASIATMPYLERFLPEMAVSSDTTYLEYMAHCTRLANAMLLVALPLILTFIYGYAVLAYFIP